VYAIGTLILWSRDAGYVDNAGEVLTRGDFKLIAIANPNAAPYGRAAVETLTAMGRYDALKPRLIMGENIAQTHHFVASGNVPLGFIAQAQMLAMKEAD